MNYSSEVENIGGGFGGMNSGGMGGWGFIIFFFLLFMIFSGGGLFNNKREDHDHYNVRNNCEPSPCAIDRDILVTAHDNELMTLAQTEKIINNQNNIYEKQQTQLLNDKNMENYFLKGQLADVAQNAPILNKLNWLESHVAIKPPEYAQTYVPTGCAIPCNSKHDCNSYC